MKFFSKLIRVLFFLGSVTFLRAQEVPVPDAGLNAAIRDALQKPAGPLTMQDLLSLTNLNADSRNVSSVEGLHCRSARRSIEGAGPFISDFIIGFRIVLSLET